MPLNMTGVITALAVAQQNDDVNRDEKTRALIFGGYGGPIAGLMAGENAVSQARVRQSRQEISTLQARIAELEGEQQEEEEEVKLRAMIREILREEQNRPPSGDGSAVEAQLDAPGTFARSGDARREFETFVEHFSRVRRIWNDASPQTRRQISKSLPGLAEALQEVDEAVTHRKKQENQPEGGGDANVSQQTEPMPMPEGG